MSNYKRSFKNSSNPIFITFVTFVQNGFYEQDWRNFEDKYKISTLDYE